MPTFRFKAKEGTGKVVEGTLMASSSADARNRLEAKGFTPVSVTTLEAGQKRARVRWARAMGPRDVARLCSHLADLLEAGLNLERALNVLKAQLDHPRLAAVVAGLQEKLKGGSSFAEALATERGLASRFDINMVKVGEAGGTLVDVLRNLALVHEKEEDVRTKIRQALLYPSLILLFGLVTVAVIMVFVIPRITQMFADLGQSLPFLTELVVATSHFLVRWGWLIVVFFSVLVVLARRELVREGGSRLLENLALKLPLLGPLFWKQDLARFGRVLGMMLRSGVTVLDAMRITEETLVSPRLKKELTALTEQVTKGSSLHEGMGVRNVFPAFVVSMCAIGEETGALDKFLEKVSVAYDKEVDSEVRSLTTLLEPLMVLAVGLVVGVIVISMLLPIFQINLVAR